MEDAARPQAQDAGYRLSRAQLVREEEWAQETQRSINEDAAARALVKRFDIEPFSDFSAK